MQLQGLQPNVVAALQLFDEVQQQGLQPNVITHTAVISASQDAREGLAALR